MLARFFQRVMDLQSHSKTQIRSCKSLTQKTLGSPIPYKIPSKSHSTAGKNVHALVPPIPSYLSKSSLLSTTSCSGDGQMSLISCIHRLIFYSVLPLMLPPLAVPSYLILFNLGIQTLSLGHHLLQWQGLLWLFSLHLTHAALPSLFCEAVSVFPIVRFQLS